MNFLPEIHRIRIHNTGYQYKKVNPSLSHALFVPFESVKNLKDCSCFRLNAFGAFLAWNLVTVPTFKTFYIIKLSS